MEKKCTKCGEVKSLDEFGNKKEYKDGKQFRCKLCQREYRKKYLEKNKDKLKEYNKKNREKNLKYYKIYYEKNNNNTKFAERGK